MHDQILPRRVVVLPHASRRRRRTRSWLRWLRGRLSELARVLADRFLEGGGGGGSNGPFKVTSVRQPRTAGCTLPEADVRARRLRGRFATRAEGAVMSRAAPRETTARARNPIPGMIHEIRRPASPMHPSDDAIARSQITKSKAADELALSAEGSRRWPDRFRSSGRATAW